MRRPTRTISREHGLHGVTGVDLSDIQIRRARQLIPSATFIRADATTVDFPTASFDAVVWLCALIHMPLDEQPPLMARIATWLRPGGWFLATTGHQAWTGTEDNWLGGAAPMWWSHADTTTYRLPPTPCNPLPLPWRWIGVVLPSLHICRHLSSAVDLSADT